MMKYFTFKTNHMELLSLQPANIKLFAQLVQPLQDPPNKSLWGFMMVCNSYPTWQLTMFWKISKVNDQGFPGKFTISTPIIYKAKENIHLTGKE